jgi:hypothetical protein
MNKWMEINWKSIKNRRLNDLFIPGTHQSGAFKYNFGITPSCGTMKNINPHILNFFTFGLTSFITNKWLVTQTLSITEQLNAGIRYLEFKIIYVNGEFYLHYTWISQSLLSALNELIMFMDNNPYEMVILKICLTHTNELIHNHLYFILRTLLLKRVVPHGKFPKLHEMHEMNRRLYIVYDQYEYYNTLVTLNHIDKLLHSYVPVYMIKCKDIECYEDLTYTREQIKAFPVYKKDQQFLIVNFLVYPSKRKVFKSIFDRTNLESWSVRTHNTLYKLFELGTNEAPKGYQLSSCIISINYANQDIIKQIVELNFVTNLGTIIKRLKKKKSTRQSQKEIELKTLNETKTKDEKSNEYISNEHISSDDPNAKLNSLGSVKKIENLQ